MLPKDMDLRLVETKLSIRDGGRKCGHWSLGSWAAQNHSPDQRLLAGKTIMSKERNVEFLSKIDRHFKPLGTKVRDYAGDRWQTEAFQN